MAGRKNKIDAPQVERRATRATSKALSASPAEQIESPQPRRKRGITPEVAGTPSQSTPAKVRTRRASLADTPQKSAGTPMRRSRRLSINSEDVPTPSKTRSLRGVRANLALVEQPVPEEEEIKRTSPSISRRRKNTEQNKTDVNLKEKTTKNGSDPTINPSPSKGSNNKEHTDGGTPKRNVGRPRKPDNLIANTSKELIRNTVVKLRKVNSESGEVSVSPVKRRTRKTLNESKEEALNNRTEEINSTENINKMEASNSIRERKVEPKNEASKNMKPPNDVIADDKEEQAALTTNEETSSVVEHETLNIPKEGGTYQHKTVKDFETGEQIVGADSENKSAQIEVSLQLDTVTSLKPVASETARELRTKEEISDTSTKSPVKTADDHVHSKLSEKSKSILNATNEPSKHDSEPPGPSTNSKKENEFLSDVSATNTKTDELAEVTVIDSENASKTTASANTSLEITDTIESASRISEMSKIENEEEPSKCGVDQRVSDTDVEINETVVEAAEVATDSLKSVLVTCEPAPEGDKFDVEMCLISEKAPVVVMKSMNSIEKSDESKSNISVVPIANSGINKDESSSIVSVSRKSIDEHTPVPESCLSTPKEPVLTKETPQSLTKDSVEQNSDVSDEESKLTSKDSPSGNESLTPVNDQNRKPAEQVQQEEKVQPEESIKIDNPTESMEEIEENNEQSFSSPSEPKRISFAKSWNQSVKGPTTKSPEEPEFIDAISLRTIKDKENSSSASIETSPKSNASKRLNDTSSMNAEEDDESESEASRNEFIDDEAMEVSEDECSLNSSERAYLEENEVPVKGESIGSEDTYDELDEEEEEDDDEDGEMASFIISESEHDKLSGNDSLLGSEDEKIVRKNKKFRRLIQNSDSSSVESNKADTDAEDSDESYSPKFSSDEDSDGNDMSKNENPTATFAHGEISNKEDTESLNQSQHQSKIKSPNKIGSAKRSVDEASSSDVITGSNEDESKTEKNVNNSSESSDNNKQDHLECQPDNEKTDENIERNQESSASTTEKSSPKISNTPQSETKHDLNESARSPKQRLSSIKSSPITISPKSRRCGTVVPYFKDSKMNDDSMKGVDLNTTESDNQEYSSSDSGELNQPTISRNASIQKAEKLNDSKNPKKRTRNDTESDKSSENSNVKRYKRISLPSTTSDQQRLLGNSVEKRKRYSVGHTSAGKRKSSQADSSEPSKTSLMRRKSKKLSSSENNSTSDSDIDGSKFKTLERALKTVNKSRESNLAVEYSTDSSDSDFSAENSTNPSTNEKKTKIQRRNSGDVSLKIKNSSNTIINLETTRQEISQDESDSNVENNSMNGEINITREEQKVNDKVQLQVLPANDEIKLVKSKRLSITRKSKSTSESSENSDSENYLCSTVEISKTDSYRAGKTSINNSFKLNRSILQQSLNQSTRKIQDDDSDAEDESESSGKLISKRNSQENENIKQSITGHVKGEKTNLMNNSLDNISKNRNSLTKRCGNFSENSEDESVENNSSASNEPKSDHKSKSKSFTLRKSPNEAKQSKKEMLIQQNPMSESESSEEESIEKKNKSINDHKSNSESFPLQKSPNESHQSKKEVPIHQKREKSGQSESTSESESSDEESIEKKNKSKTSPPQSRKSFTPRKSLNESMQPKKGKLIYQKPEKSGISDSTSQTENSEDVSFGNKNKINSSNKVVDQKYANVSSSKEHKSDQKTESKVSLQSHNTFTPGKTLNNSTQLKIIDALHQKLEKSDSTAESEDETDSIVKVGNISRKGSSSKLKTVPKPTQNSPMNKSMKSNGTDSLYTTKSPKKRTSLNTSGETILGKKQVEKIHEDLKISTAIKPRHSLSTHSQVNSSLNAKSSDSSEDTSSEKSKSLINAKQNEEVAINVASTSYGKIFFDGSRKMNVIKDLIKGSAKEKDNPEGITLSDVVSIINKSMEEANPRLDESINEELDKVIMIARKKCQTSDNKIVLEEISKIVSKSLMDYVKFDLNQDKPHALREQNVNKKKLRKKRQKMKKAKKNRGVDSKNESSSTSDSREQNSISVVKEIKIMRSNKHQDSKCDTMNDTENSRSDGLLFKSLKEMNQSTPANRENITINRMDVKYSSTTEQKRVKGAKQPSNDEKLIDKAAKKGTTIENQSASGHNSKFSKKANAFEQNSNITAHSSSDNSFENYNPQSKCRSKETISLKTKIHPNKKKKKFGQESEVLKELIINSIESKKEKIKKKGKQNIQGRFFGNSNAQDMISAFEAYKTNKNNQDQSTDGSIKQKRELDETIVSANSSSNSKCFTSVNNSDSSQQNDWVVTDLSKKKRESVLANLPFGFEERSATPKKMNGFEVKPLTPKHHSWKVTSLQANLNECPGKTLKEKKIKHKISSREKVWTSVGYFQVTDADHIVQHKKHPRSFTTDSEMQAFKRRKY